MGTVFIGILQGAFADREAGAKLFHYVVTIGKGKGKRIDNKVAKRLAEAG